MIPMMLPVLCIDVYAYTRLQTTYMLILSSAPLPTSLSLRCLFMVCLGLWACYSFEICDAMTAKTAPFLQL